MSRRVELGAAFGAGLVFAVGLALLGMTQPSKVSGFLDLAGDWDPSLAFVMGGAVLVHFVAVRLLLRRGRPFVAPRFDLPSRKDIDASLVLGAALFGLGWGLAGYCPGPALVSAAAGEKWAISFVVAMAVGMLVQHAVAERKKTRAEPALD